MTAVCITTATAAQPAFVLRPAQWLQAAASLPVLLQCPDPAFNREQPAQHFNEGCSASIYGEELG